jgi:hypothetical protein
MLKLNIGANVIPLTSVGLLGRTKALTVSVLVHTQFKGRNTRLELKSIVLDVVRTPVLLITQTAYSKSYQCKNHAFGCVGELAHCDLRTVLLWVLNLLSLTVGSYCSLSGALTYK